jgi:hypothetical protein
MSTKLKILGLGVLAVMATSAFAVVNASATITGHFTAEPTEHHVIVKGTDAYGSAHQLVFKETGSTGPGISCTHSEYHGTLGAAGTPVESTTTQSVTVRPKYTNCATENETWGTTSVIVPESCGTNVFQFTSRTTGHGTVKVNCTITIKHPNCEITVPSGQLLGGAAGNGVTWTTTVEKEKHALTANITVLNIAGQFHGGICVFLGTPHTFTMTGSATVWGENTVGGRVGITHT